MNPSSSEENSSLCGLLGRLPAPAVPSADLMARLQAARPAPVARKHGWFRPLTLAALFTTLGVPAMLMHRPKTPPVVVAQPAKPTPVNASQNTARVEVMEPVVSQQHLLSMRPVGLVRDRQDRPVRLVECTWLDLQTFGSVERTALSESALRREIVPVLLPVQ